MKSIFAELPNDIICLIIQIENDRKIEELLTKRKYNEVIQELNKLSGRYCDLDEGYWYSPLCGLAGRSRYRVFR